MPRICDYEGSNYRTEFWEGQNRAYEDGVERVAIRKTLPPTGRRLLEIGAGFGRLADLYEGYQQVVLVDYARTQLEEARRYLPNPDRFIFVVADVYRLPFVDNLFDTLSMVRVMHHLTDVPTALRELQRILAANGTALVEHASKQHLKAIARWLLGQQGWNPFSHKPVEFVALNFDYHPAWMQAQFKEAGFAIQNIRTLSHFRIPLVKQLFPTPLLVTLDSIAQETGNWWQLTPSVLLQAIARKSPQPPVTRFFRCPACRHAELYLAENPHNNEGHLFCCPHCHHGWPHYRGIFDFKTPIDLN